MNLINRIKRRRQINRAMRELSNLNDQTLADIGIERGNIAALVEEMIDSKARPTMVAVEREQRAPEHVTEHAYRVTTGATA